MNKKKHVNKHLITFVYILFFGQMCILLLLRLNIAVMSETQF